MKINSLKIASFVTALSGTAVLFGNYIWLLGFAVKPAPDLFEARFWYAVIAYTVSGFLFGIGSQL